MAERPIKSLSDLMDGGVEERFNDALAKVWENVYDPNTEARRARKVIMKVKIIPNERRDSCDFRVDIAPKLAPPATLSQTVMLNLGMNGEIIATEREKVRHVIAGCSAHTPKIYFERYLDTEQFNTMLLSTFIDTEARKLLFTVVKSMTKEQNLNTTDDGVSQVITVKQGISTASNVQFQNPVPLKPMRTFIEIEQPESNFTLRVNERAECALFESDGGAWKNIAVQRIASYIRSMIFVSNVVVLA